MNWQVVNLEGDSKKGSSVVIAAMISASVSILLIGSLNLFAEISEGFKEFLIFYPGMGPLSGKVIIAYVAGLAAFFLLFRWRTLSRQSMWTWTAILIAAIVVSSLLVTTPFIELFLK